MQRLQTDEQPTEISSNVNTSSPDTTSMSDQQDSINPQQKQKQKQKQKSLTDTDKQILRWAATLEMETIELREHSQRLIQQLNSKYVDFEEFVKRFGSVETRLEKKVTDCFDDLKKKLDRDISKQIKAERENAPVSLTSSTVDKRINREKDGERDFRLRNLGSQMESMQLLLVHISRELLNLNTRQVSLENVLERMLAYEKVHENIGAGNNCDKNRACVSLDGTTYEEPEELKNRGILQRGKVGKTTDGYVPILGTPMKTRSKTGARVPHTVVAQPRTTRKKRRGCKWGKTKRPNKSYAPSFKDDREDPEPSRNHSEDKPSKPRTLIPWDELTDTEPFNHFSSEL